MGLVVKHPGSSAGHGADMDGKSRKKKSDASGTPHLAPMESNWVIGPFIARRRAGDDRMFWKKDFSRV